MYLNVEPIHFDSESAVHVVPDPNRIFQHIQARNALEIGYGILLDDTGSPGVPVRKDEVDQFVRLHGIGPCVQIRETDLKPLALSVLLRLPEESIRVERRNVMYHRGGEQFAILREFPKHAARRPTRWFLDFVRESVGVVDGGESILPTCTLYTAAWHLLRLVLPYEIWRLMANTGSDFHGRYIFDLAGGLASKRRVMAHANLLTYIPKTFERNEYHARLLLEPILTQSVSLPLDELIRNEWY